MKKLVALLVVLSIVFGSFVSPVFAAQGRKGASDMALQKANEESAFNRVGDWFATRGKTESEKKAVLAERKLKRAAEKAQKKAQKRKKEAEKKAKEAKKKMQEQMKKMGK